MPTDKLCINCEYHHVEGVRICKHPESDRAFNPVNGYSCWPMCSMERGEYSKTCGPEGNNFSPIPPKPPTFWQKLFRRNPNG